MTEELLNSLLTELERAGVQPHVELVREALWLASQGVRLELAGFAPPSTLPAAPAQQLPVDSGASTSEPRTPIAREEQPRNQRNPFAGPQETAASPGRNASGMALHAFGDVDEDVEKVKASAVPVPAASALPASLPISRAFRPFNAKWPSPQQAELDEEATVEATAEHGGQVMPVIRPVKERWFEVHIVVESGPSMMVWTDTVREFRLLLARTGVFQDVRLWRFALDPGDGPAAHRAFVWSGLRDREGDSKTPARYLASRHARSLILFATHGVSPGWTDGSMRETIAEWGATASVALVHMLPPHLWVRTALGDPSVWASALAPGAVLQEMRIERPWWASGADGVAVPLFPMDADAIANWSLAQMARGRQTPAVVVGSENGVPDSGQPDGSADVTSSIEAFRSSSSPEAYELAVYLSSSAFTLPVARLVQSAMFGAAARQSHLAEVLMSGLLRRRSTATTDPNRTYFEFFPDAMSILRRSLRGRDAKALAADLERHVSEYLMANRGQTVNFRALVRSENGEFDLPAYAQPFAELGMALLGVPGAGSAAKKFEEFLAARRGKAVEAAGLFAKGVLERSKKPGPAWAADACNMVVCEEPLWAILLEHGMLLEPAPRRYELLPGLLERLAEVAPGVEILETFPRRPFLFFTGVPSHDRELVDEIIITDLPFRREHLIRAADFVVGDLEPRDRAVVSRYGLRVSGLDLPTRVDPPVLEGVPERADFAAPLHPDVAKLREQTETSPPTKIFTVLLTSKDYDARGLLIDYLWANEWPFADIVWGKEMPGGDQRGQLTIVDGTPELPIVGPMGDVIFLDPHPDVIFMYQVVRVFDGTSMPGEGELEFPRWVAERYPNGQGLRYLFDFASRAGIDWQGALELLRREPSDRLGTDLATVLRGEFSKFSKEEMETLRMLAAVDTGWAIPKLLLDELPTPIWAKFEQLLITRPSNTGLRLSEIGVHAILRAGIKPAPRAVLRQYVVKFTGAPWWRIPEDGFLHQNLMRLMERPERPEVLRQPLWWRLRIEHGGAAVAEDLKSVDLSLPDTPDYRGTSGRVALAQTILRNLNDPTPEMKALSEGARMYLARRIWQGKLPRVMVVNRAVEEPWWGVVEESGFVPMKRPENAGQLQTAVASAQAILTEDEPDDALLDASMEANVPLIAVPFVRAGHGDENLTAIVGSQLAGVIQQREAAPSWKNYAASLATYLLEPSELTASLTNVYRFPHFRQWAYYAGRGKKAAREPRTALLLCVVSRSEAGRAFEYPGDAVDAAFWALQSKSKEHQLELQVIIQILRDASMRDQVLQTRRRLPRVDDTSTPVGSAAWFRVTVFNLAQDYNDTLRGEQAGLHRTAVISKLAGLIRERVSSGTAPEYRDLVTASDPGHRLWGYLGLEKTGTSGDISLLVQQVVSEPEHSAQLHGLQAIAKLSSSLGSLPVAIRGQLETLTQTLRKGGRRWAVLQTILGSAVKRAPAPKKKTTGSQRPLPRKK